MYFNGEDMHIGVIKKGHGLNEGRKILKNRNARAVIKNDNIRTIKLVEHLGFVFQKQDGKYTYMVKSCQS